LKERTNNQENTLQKVFTAPIAHFSCAVRRTLQTHTQHLTHAFFTLYFSGVAELKGMLKSYVSSVDAYGILGVMKLPSGIYLHCTLSENYPMTM
jgi:hypothetical protein